MKTNKTTAFFIIFALIVSLWISWVSASGPADGTGNNPKDNYVEHDDNDNGIGDGKEDDDNDGVENRDDEDYDHNLENMNDDDNDWISNRDDEDYERSPALDWTNRPESAWTGDWVNTNWKWDDNRSSRAQLLKLKYKTTLKRSFSAKINSFTQEQNQLILNKIEELKLWVDNWVRTQAQVESIFALLDWLKELIQERVQERVGQ